MPELTSDDIQKLRNLIRKVETLRITGPYVTGSNGPTGISFHVGAPRKIASPGGSSLPRATGRYKVLMLIDDLDPGTPGWDYPKFHG